MFFIQIKDYAENSTNKYTKYALDQLFFWSVDYELKDYGVYGAPVFKNYLIKLFENITKKPFNPSQHEIVTSYVDLKYLFHLSHYIKDLPEHEMELYIWWKIVEAMLPHTTSDMHKLSNEYENSRVQIPKSLDCAHDLNEMMGMVVSYVIANPKFLTNVKPKVHEMLNNIRETFNNLVRETNWLDDKTKYSILDKSLAMRSFIGFPEWIFEPEKLNEHYSGLKFSEPTHLKNMVSFSTWKMKGKMLSLFKTRDFEWPKSLSFVNAYHMLQDNAIGEFLRITD